MNDILKDFVIYYEVILGSTTYYFYDFEIAKKFISYAILGCTDLSDLNWITLHIKIKGGLDDRTTD